MLLAMIANPWTNRCLAHSIPLLSHYRLILPVVGIPLYGRIAAERLGWKQRCAEACRRRSHEHGLA
jgi:hypothetical protein